MKNLNTVIFTAFSGLLLMTSMAGNNSEAASFQEIDLKRNKQLKERVFEQVLNDKELFSDFISKMRENNQAMQWMQENRPMMQTFYGRKQMQDMMRWNPEMPQNMMQNMIQLMERDSTVVPRNPEMRQQMMQNLLRMMERDTARMNPEIREQMLDHMRRMMARDTLMQNRMQEMMQDNHMMRNN